MAGKRRVAQRQSGTTEPRREADMRKKLYLLNVSFKFPLTRGWGNLSDTPSVNEADNRRQSVVTAMFMQPARELVVKKRKHIRQSAYQLSTLTGDTLKVNASNGYSQRA